MSHRSRYQKGYLYQRKFQGELWWYLRYYDVDGTRPDVRLAKASEYRTKKNVLPLVDELLRPFREGEVTISSATTLSQFWTNNYLPWLQGNRRPSTVWGYKQIWTGYLEMEAGSIRLRDFDLATSETLLATIQKHHDLNVLTLRHIKNVLSGIFTRARKLKVLVRENPMRDVDIPNCRPRGETYAYRLEEVQQFLSVLEGTAKVVIALAAFGGFSKAELQGLRWENYRGNEITVTLNVIRGKIGEPKTEKRQSAVHIIALLNKLLGEYRANVGNPQSGFLFLSENQTPLQLDNLLHREILKCNTCGRERYHKVHTLKTFRNFHEYKPLPGLPKWHGWHAFRRGLATNLHRLGVADITIQGILRHEDVATTRQHYIKEAPAAGHNGLERLEAEFLLLDDCRRKLQTTPGSKLVN